MHVMVSVSPGELVDKVTILRIKYERIKDKAKLANVGRELDLLTGVYKSFVGDDPKIPIITDQLKKVNEEIWDFEDVVRDAERTQTFDELFITTARGIYKSNDKRARLKRELNDLLKSEVVEEKSYADYE